MNLFKMGRAFGAAIVLATAFGSSHAAVVNSANVGSYRTFQDTSSGLVWLDMDNFFDSATGTGSMTGLQSMAAAQAAGFQVATRAQVQAMLNTLPLTGGQWAGYASIMGFGDPRDLIWGLTNDAGTYGWAWAFSNDTAWQYSGAGGESAVAAGNPAGSQDLGVWAFRVADDHNVPEPGMLGLFALAAAAGLLARRRAR